MNVELIEVRWGNPADLFRFAAIFTWGAADPTTGEAQRELLSYLTVVVGHDVSRIGVGHSLSVLLRVYAKCLDGGEEAAQARVQRALEGH